LLASGRLTFLNDSLQEALVLAPAILIIVFWI
jgi:hypothetical protein